MNRGTRQPSISGQATVPDGNAGQRIRPEQVWERLSPAQRQVVYQALVQLGRCLQYPAGKEVHDERA